jgi:hypothetical protein
MTTMWLSLLKVTRMYFYLLSRHISVISDMNFLETSLVPDSSYHIIRSFPRLLETMVLFAGDSLPTKISSSWPLKTVFCLPRRVHSLRVVSLEPVRMSCPSWLNSMVVMASVCP